MSPELHAVPQIPEAVLANTSRSKRIIATYERLLAEAKEQAEDEPVREPSLESVAAAARVSKRDVGPVIKTHHRLTELRETYANIPATFLMQMLATVNAHFDTLDKKHQTVSEEQQSAFDEGVETFSEEVRHLETRLAETELLVAEKQSELNEGLEQIEQLTEENRQWTLNYNNLEGRYRQSAAEARESNLENERLKGQILDLEAKHSAQLAKAETDYQTMRKELIDQHEAANNKLMTQLGNSRADVKSLQTKLDKKEQQFNSTLIELRDCHHRVSEYNIELDQLRGELKQNRADNARIAPLEKELELVRQDNRQLKEENARLQSLAQTPDKLQDQLAQIQASIVSMGEQKGGKKTTSKGRTKQ